jgi:hypothetical protein
MRSACSGKGVGAGSQKTKNQNLTFLKRATPLFITGYIFLPWPILLWKDICSYFTFSFFLFFFFWDWASIYSQAGLQLLILLPQPPKYWDNKHTPSRLALTWLLKDLLKQKQEHLENFTCDHENSVYLTITCPQKSAACLITEVY